MRTTNYEPPPPEQPPLEKAPEARSNGHDQANGSRWPWRSGRLTTTEPGHEDGDVASFSGYAAPAPSERFIRSSEGQIFKGHPQNISIAVQHLGLILHRNEFSTQTEVGCLAGFGPELTDPGAARIRLLIHERFGFLPPERLFETVLTDIAHANRFHPVRDWLAGIAWDGVPRIDNWLRDYAGAKDTPFNRAVGRIFLIAGVRRVRRPGCKFDTLLVLESPQGKNKSKSLRALAVKGKWFTDNLPLSADSKEVIEATNGIWLAEFADLSGIGRRDINHLKALLSRQDDRARPAYGRRSERVPRQFVACATTNDSQYLIDDENRRFWPVAINRFNLEDLMKDAPQLWAEAAHYEADGESITLQEDLWETAAEVQAERQIEDPIFDKLAGKLGGKTGWIAATDVWETLGVPIQQRSGNMAMAVGRAMGKLGFTRRQITARGDKKGERGQRFYECGETEQERSWEITAY